MSYFDLKKYLAEGGLGAKLSESHSNNPNDKYIVKKCTKKENEPWAVWEGKTRVKGFTTKAEAEKYARKQNKKQNLKENESAPSISDDEFIMALTKAFSAADEASLDEGEDYEKNLEEDLDEGQGRPAGSGLERSVNFKYFTGDKNYDNILRLLQQFNKLYTSKDNPTLDPRAKKSRKPFSTEELENLANLFSSKENITTRDIMAAIPRYAGKSGTSTANANTFLKVMGDLGRSKVTTVSQKFKDAEAKEKRASGETPEARGRKRRTDDEDKFSSTSKGFKNEPDEEDLEDIDISDIEDYFKTSREDEDLFENDLFLNKLLKKQIPGNLGRS